MFYDWYRVTGEQYGPWASRLSIVLKCQDFDFHNPLNESSQNFSRDQQLSSTKALKVPEELEKKDKIKSLHRITQSVLAD